MVSSRLTKKNNVLGYIDKKDKTLYDLFISSIKEGEEIEIFICRKTSDASPAQIAKVHACIREIAGELGYSFDDIKLIIKEKSGLCYEVVDEGQKKVLCKSFADISKEEMTLAIEACNQIAADNNIILG